MNFYRYTIGLSLALLIGSLSGCGDSCCAPTKMVEPAGFENVVEEKVAAEDGIIAKDADKVIVLKDNNNIEIAKITLLKNTELKSGEINKCKCESSECTPCAVSIKRSCGNLAVDTEAKTVEIQNGLDSTQLALLSASYDIKINKKIESGDILTNPIDVSLKVPKCVHDKASDKYFNYKNGEVKDIKIWVQPLDSGEEGYWLEKSFTQDQIKSGKLNFQVSTPNSHIVLVAVVDRPLATGATGGS